ncbi:MAG: M23 family metallopeptidase [Parvibaculum sp.]
MRRAIALTLAFILAALTSARADVVYVGKAEQGALLIGRTIPGSRVTLDGQPLMISSDGVFAFGFSRDHGPRATLTVMAPDGTEATRTIAVEPRKYEVQRIDGIAPKYVSPPADVLKRIAEEKALKAKSRPDNTDAVWFAEKFIWPAMGPVSGVYGSQRIFNGEPRRPHFGMDIAAPTGAPVRAPADGIVTLANPDMYFEGGLIFIDHGQGVSTNYMHLSRLDVKSGGHVKQGDLIGAVGGTGRATGPHLHWGMTWRGTPLDPQLLVADHPE